MTPLFKSLLPPFLMAAIMALAFVLPDHPSLEASAISPNMPSGAAIRGWIGKPMQESEREREALASDTKFSKAYYIRETDALFRRPSPPVITSIVYSGRDMNSSIHRPERCLPAQGHMNLDSSSKEIKLSDGRSIIFTRLTSFVPMPHGSRVEHVNYYVFIGKKRICHTHLQRTLWDMYDRIFGGYVQRWAYFQAGSYWGGDTPYSETEADTAVQQLTSQLLPSLINWNAIEK